MAETNKGKKKRQKKIRRTAKEVVINTVVVAQTEYDDHVRVLVAKPWLALRRLNGELEGQATPDDWRQLQMRTAVGKHMASMFEYDDEVNDPIMGGALAVKMIANAYNEGGCVRLRASPMELTMLGECLDMIDALHEALSEASVLRAYRAAQRELNGKE